MSEQRQKDILIYNYIKSNYPDVAEAFRKSANLEANCNIDGQITFILGSNNKRSAPVINGSIKKVKVDSPITPMALKSLGLKKMVNNRSSNIGPSNNSESSDNEGLQCKSPSFKKLVLSGFKLASDKALFLNATAQKRVEQLTKELSIADIDMTTYEKEKPKISQPLQMKPMKDITNISNCAGVNVTKDDDLVDPADDEFLGSLDLTSLIADNGENESF